MVSYYLSEASSDRKYGRLKTRMWAGKLSRYSKRIAAKAQRKLAKERISE